MLELAGRSPVLWQVLRPGTEYSSENPKDLELYRKIGEQLPGFDPLPGLDSRQHALATQRR